MINYTRHHVTDADIAAVVSVLKSDRLTQGPTVPLLEDELCKVIGCNHAVCVSSGTAGLALAYLASERYAIRTSPISCMATPNAALSVGLQVEFGDTDAMHGLLDPAEHCPRGVLQVPVWLAGKFAQIPEGPCVIDACQALWHIQLKDALQWVDGAVISFHPTKVIAAGEGGAVVTNNPDFAMRIREMRDYGRDVETRRQVRLGLNYRMDEMSAALALSQLSRLDENIARRSALVDLYDDQLRGVEEIQRIPHSGLSTCYLYQVHCVGVDRDVFRKRLLDRGIETQIHHPPIHLEPYYRKRFGYDDGDFPNAEAFGATVVTLPLYSTMTREEVGQVVEAVKGAVHGD